jgi:hypothetical protein
MAASNRRLTCYTLRLGNFLGGASNGVRDGENGQLYLERRWAQRDSP